MNSAYFDLKCSLLLKAFKEHKVNIDNITIDESKNDLGAYFVTFWYNKKVVDYSYKMEKANIEHYLNGISLVYSYEWENNH